LGKKYLVTFLRIRPPKVVLLIIIYKCLNVIGVSRVVIRVNKHFREFYVMSIKILLETSERLYDFICGQ
jgi:hypothetical protein